MTATLIKTVTKTLTPAEWKSLRYTYHKASHEEAFGVAAKKAKATGRAHYVCATHRGFVIIDGDPTLPPGQRYYRITVDGNTVKGELLESGGAA